MNRDEAMRFLHQTGYQIEEVRNSAWKIRAPSGEIVGRVAGEEMLVAFVALLQMQHTTQMPENITETGRQH